jgi:ribonuclease HII
MLKKYLSDDEIGLDEAGRGPLIGRVYAGAVVLGNNIKDVPSIITDSKKLTAKKRAIALKWIKENVKAWGYGFAEPAEIDQINILEATNMAMKRAIEKLKNDFPECKDSNNLIIDGCYWEKRFPNYNVKSFVKGDATYISIAAASIIAKEYHDMHIKELCQNNIGLNEKYDLENNMGYGTKKHLAGLELHGNSIFHRKSFKPCCNYI